MPAGNLKVVLFIAIFGFHIIPAGVMFSIAAGVLGNVVWASLGAISSQTGLAAVRSYGIGFASYMFGSSLGWLLGNIIDSLGLDNFQVLFTWAAIAIVVVVPLTVLRAGDVKKLSQVMRFDDDGFGEEALEEAEAFGGEKAAESQASKRVANSGEVADSAGSKVLPFEGAKGLHSPSDGDALGELGAPGTEVAAHPSWWRFHMMELASEYKLTDRETEVFVLW